MDSRKTALMNLSAGQRWRRQTETRLVDTGREGEGGMNAVSNMETCTLPYVIFSRHSTGIGALEEGVISR